MKRVLLTGASGFVGRQILNQLLLEDVEIVIVTRTQNQQIFPQSRKIKKIILSNDPFDENEIWWESACAGVDTVIHSAWFVEHGKFLSSPRNLECIIGTLNLAKGAVKASVSKFVGLGTCLEYAPSQLPLNANSPIAPKSIYAASKASLFQVLHSWFENQSISFAWCRLFYLFGEGEDPRRLAANISKKLANNEEVFLNSPKLVRDFLDVRIAGEKIVKVALGDKTGPQNICSGNGISVGNFAEEIASSVGKLHLIKSSSTLVEAQEEPYIVGVPSL